MQAQHNALAPLYALKRKFVQKKAISGVTAEQAAAIDGRGAGAELEALFNEPLTEESFVEHVSRWLEDEAEHHGAVADRRAICRVGRAVAGRASKNITTACCSRSRTSWT